MEVPPTAFTEVPLPFSATPNPFISNYLLISEAGLFWYAAAPAILVGRNLLYPLFNYLSNKTVGL